MIDLGWSFAVLVVVVVVSSSWSPLWASSSSRPRLRRRSPVLRWTFAFQRGWPPKLREGYTLCSCEGHTLCDHRGFVVVVVVVVVVSLISWCRLFDQRIAGTASRCRCLFKRRHLSSAVSYPPPSSSSLSSPSESSFSSSSCRRGPLVVVVIVS